MKRIKIIDKPLARLIRRKKEKKQIINIRNERENITTDAVAIKRMIRQCYEQFYTIKLNLDEMDKFLERFKLPKLTQAEVDNLSSLISIF